MMRFLSLICANALLLEVLSFGILQILEKVQVVPSIEHLASDIDPDAAVWTDVSNKILHPYFGYASINNPLGFDTKKNILHKRSDNAFIIGVFGGSVAHQLSDWHTELLQNALHKYPEFNNVNIHIVPVSMGGFKQPQQLMALNYVLLLGGEFDAIVLLDGFNEVAVAFAENEQQGVVPFFPRAWAYHVRSKVRDSKYDALYNKTSVQFSRRNTLARWLQNDSLYVPYTLRLALRVSYAYYNRAYIQHEDQLRAYRSTNAKDVQASGPWNVSDSTEDRMLEMVDIWKRSSEMMHNIATAHHAIYIHALQPNQYVDSSKVFTDEEEVLFSQGSPYIEWVKRGYPLLQRRGKELQKEGITFADMTSLFSKEHATVYSDACCHLNSYGNALLAKELARRIVEEIHVKR